MTRSILHDELVRRSEFLLSGINRLWDGDRFQDALFTWAGAVVNDDQGFPINDLVGCNLPEDRAGHDKIALEMAIRTSACGLLRVRREEDRILAVMETPHGSRSWAFPFCVRGDSRVIGSPTVRDNEDSVGVLWKKDMGRG